MPEYLRRIVVATDESRGATLAAEAATGIAASEGSILHLVQVLPGPGLPTTGRDGLRHLGADDLVRESEARARNLLRGQAWRAKSAGATVAEKHLRTGDPAGEISALAEEVGADLIVVGSRKGGALRRLISGSVSSKVAREASRPVLVVRGGWPPSSVVVGDDLSEEAVKAGELAAAIGGMYGAPVRLTTAYHPSNWYVGYAAHHRRVREKERRIRRELRGRAAALGKALGEKPRTEVAPRRPDDVLREASVGGEATLVAVGRRDLSIARRTILGGVSDRLLRAAHGSVLIVPPSAGKDSPGGRQPQHRNRPAPAPRRSSPDAKSKAR